MLYNDIKFYESIENGYLVSKCGKILSLKKNNPYLMTPCKTTKGYLQVRLNRKMFRVHRIIALTFIPNPNNLETVDHINENKIDNRVENLQWLSNRDNIRKSRIGIKFTDEHKLKLRNAKLGKPSVKDKFNKQDAFKMKEMLENGMKAKDVADEFGIGRTSVYNYIKRLNL